MDGLVTIHWDNVKLFSLTQSRWCVVQRPRCYQVKCHMVTEAQPQGSVKLCSQEPGGEPLMLCAIPLLTTTSLLEGSQTRLPFWGEAQLQYHQRDLFMCWRNRERVRATYRALRCNTCRMCMFHPEWYTFLPHCIQGLIQTRWKLLVDFSLKRGKDKLTFFPLERCRKIVQ